MEGHMDNSIFLSKLIGPYIIVIGVGLVFNRKLFRQILEDFPKNHALVYLSGLITFVTGLAIVLTHNIWARDWRTIITVFGWMALVKGIWLIIRPGAVEKMTRIYLKHMQLVLIPWAIMLLIGLFLTIKGYL
jgi:uncharacterized membrane protein